MFQRSFWVALHRWAGLTMTIFLILVGLTGSILAFREDLDHWLNADLFDVTIKDAPMLDVFDLREKAEALEPRARVDAIDLRLPAGRSFAVILAPKTDSQTGKPFDLPIRQLFLDPYTGETIDARDMQDVSLGRRGVMNFILRLHTSLALPENFAAFGRTLLGIVALAWTIDCFLGFYLTLPLRIGAEGARRSWWSRWRAAWLIRRNGGPYRLNFDIHRAFGLWTWAMLFVFAWSGVSFNLSSVYTPVMSAAFDMGVLSHHDDKPLLDTPLENPTNDFRGAHARGRELMAQLAAQKGFAIEDEIGFAFNRGDGQYVYSVKSSRDWTEWGGTAVFFHADTGALARVLMLSDVPAGAAITFWLMFLHMAAVFGLPMKLFVCAMGLVVAALCVTGVYIWWKKRKARRFHKARGASAGAALEATIAD
jgi:uncharacterized iron-regulated membrane protein